jgi:hypothetical protein
MLDARPIALRSLLSGLALAAAADSGMAEIIFPSVQTPFTMPANPPTPTVANVCTFRHSSSKKKNDFDVTVDWGDATPIDSLHPAKTGKSSYVIRASHTYTSVAFPVARSCRLDADRQHDRGKRRRHQYRDGERHRAGPDDDRLGRLPMVGATSLTGASVPGGAANYAWSILDGNGNDVSSLITAGHLTAAITFNAAPAGSMFISPTKKWAPARPRTSARRYRSISPT